MSIQAINWALEQPGNPTQKHVLLVLANFANESGHAFPANVLLARTTGLNEKSVRRAKTALIENGLIETCGHKNARYLRLRLECNFKEKDTAPPKEDRKSDDLDTGSRKTDPDFASPHLDFKAHQKDRKSAPYNHQ